MTETVLIPVSDSAWTDVTDTARKGMITNNSQHDLRYRQSASQPLITDTFGHVLHPAQNRYFDLPANFTLWALGFNHDSKVALTKEQGPSTLISAFEPVPVTARMDDTANLDAFTRFRTSEPFGIYDNKNISSRNRNQWHEKITGVIITYTGLVGTFTTEEVRQTTSQGLIAIGTIVSDNGADTMVINTGHNDFEIGGNPITGQTSGATATIATTTSGSDSQHDYDKAAVILKVGTGSGDKTIRQTVRYHAYVPGKSHLILCTFTMGSAITNVRRRAGYFDDLNGLYFEQNGSTDIAMAIRSSVTGSPVNNRKTQNEWNMDKLDGSEDPDTNPSFLNLDITKAQILFIDFQWLGVGRVRFGFVIDGKPIYVHEFKHANIIDTVYMRTATLPIRYEIENLAATGSQSNFEEICSSVASEGGYTLPGLEFSASAAIATRSITIALVPLFAIRLKNEFPSGKPNRRTIKFLNAGNLGSTNDAHLEIRHIHEPIDIIATWQDVGGGSAVEYSLDITAITGNPAHNIEHEFLPTAVGNKSRAEVLQGELLNLHGFASQNIDSNNSEVFVIYGQSFTGNADIASHISYIEFE